MELHGHDLIPRSQIYIDPEKNARKTYDPKAIAELAESFKKIGVLHPPIVRMIAPDKYELVAGYRRMRALDALGEPVIPCTVVDADEARAIEMMLAENIIRRDVAPWDLGAAVLLYIQKGKTFEYIQERLVGIVERSVTIDRLKKLAHTTAFLSPDLLAVWMRGTSEFGDDEAYRVSQLTEEEQFDYLANLLGGAIDGPAGIPSGTGDRKKKKGQGRPRPRTIELAYQSLKAHDDDAHDDGLSSDERRGARLVLQWVIGGRHKCPIKLRSKKSLKKKD